jgi:hypothetical protein
VNDIAVSKKPFKTKYKIKVAYKYFIIVRYADDVRSSTKSCAALMRVANSLSG